MPNPLSSPGAARSRRSRSAVLAAAATALVCLVGASTPGGAAVGSTLPPAPEGAAGIGDDYYPRDGNGSIDVRAYRVHVRYQFADRELAGRTVVVLEATSSVSSFHLDLLLPVREVTVDGRRVGFARPHPHELEVRAPLVEGRRYDVVVRYGGHPDRHAYAGESNWLASGREVVTMNEPHMAPWWFPANDHPRDKARFDIHVDVPAAKRVVANGVLMGREVRGRRAVTHWRAVEPMAPYLAYFAAGPYAVDQGVHDGLPWHVAVSRNLAPGEADRAMALMRRSAAVVRWMEQDLGPYPFATTGGVTTALEPGFALENQTRPIYPVNGANLPTVVHEIAHQWFGDSVSVARWRDIWLNEGPATFMEARWEETHGGQSAAEWLDHWYDALDDADFWRLDIADPGPGRLFDWAVYQRGGMALQALRQRISEGDFWELLRRWLGDRREGNGTSEEFERLAAEISGEDLTAFFDAWLRDPRRPPRTADNGLA